MLLPHNGNADNHYGTTAVNTALQNIANDYSNMRAHRGDILRYNDISLSNGGVFDLNSDWNPAPPPLGDGHLSHGCGTDIDVGLDALNARGRMVAVNQNHLADLVNRHFPGAFVMIEGNHFHIHFTDCT